MVPALAAVVLTGDARNAATARRKASTVMRRHSNSRVNNRILARCLFNRWMEIALSALTQVREMNLVRERLHIQLKLSVVMGLPWMFEPVSWALDSTPAVTDALPFSTCWIWLITDLVNMLQESLVGYYVASFWLLNYMYSAQR